ncbi:MAG: twin-arginine translocase TatA/TatE family subunit, partial [Planctomycetota bacterium]|nr:twin-arginine translocase TatA/TatE family subunit [Planctomycetota bacterium]
MTGSDQRDPAPESHPQSLKDSCMTPSTFMSLESLTSPVLAFGMPSGWEWIALLAIGLLVFGRRLPEVGRSVGKSIVEFK